MTINEIKAVISTERNSNFQNLIMEEQYQQAKLPDGTLADPKIVPPILTPWLRHWDNISRTEVIIHSDTYDFIVANVDTPQLVLTSEAVDKPKNGGQPYTTYFVSKMKNIKGVL